MSIRSRRLQEDSRVTGIVPAERAAGTVDGTVINQLARTAFEGCLAVLKTGAASGTPDAQSVKLQIHHSDAAGSGFVAVSGLEVESTADGQVKELHFDPNSLKQYWKPVIVTAFTAGTAPKIGSDVTLIEYGAARAPVA